MRNDRLLFEALEIQLQAGQMLVVEGPNGCGKTSLLRILTGLRMADSGDVLWRGEPIDRLTGDYYEQVNYVGHHDGVKHELSCLENLRLARAMGIPSTLDLDDVLERVNLYAYGETEAGSLSAGQKRRLALARLLATEASLWILDEPFTSLDKDSMALFGGLFEAHLQQLGVIVMTSHHDISLPTQSLQRLRLGLSS
jgi:heme exporter protein A